MISGTWLLTGLRGNGKTLRAVELMAKEIEAGREVYASNFTGLNLPGVQILDDPRQWQDLPPGSVLFVDEAQRFWRSRRSGDPAPEVIAMETQRHDGISMVLLTQQPTYLDKHVRGLVDRHFHLVRRAGLEASQVYEWERCKDEPESPANMELADKSVWPFPKQLYGAYRSAEVHTVKRRIPARLKLVIAGAVVVAALFWYALGTFSKDDPASEAPAGTAGVPAAGGTPVARTGPVRTAESIAASLRERIPGAPWSAPIYDDVVEVQQPPKLACMIGESVGCICLTDQGTRYNMQQAECRLVVKRGGVFNPYLASDERRRGTRNQQRRQQQAERADAAAEPSVAGAIITAGQMAAYGDIGQRQTVPAGI